MSRPAVLYRVLVLANLLNLAAIWIVPASHLDARAVVAERMAYSSLCHQRPDRTLQIAGALMPVCSRCAAFYTGLTAGLLLARLGGPRRRALLLGALLLGIELGGEIAGLSSSSLTRFLASLPLAVMIGMSAGSALSAARRHSPSDRHPSLNIGVGRELKEGSTS